MFCPNCGTPPQLPDQKFCKSCGMNLMVVSQVVKTTSTNGSTAPSFQGMPLLSVTGGQGSPVDAAGGTAPLFEYEAKRQKLKRLGLGMMLGCFPVTLFFLILGEIIHRYSWELGEALRNIGLFGPLLFVTGLCLQVYVWLAFKKLDGTQVVFLPQANAAVITPPAKAEPGSVPQAQLAAANLWATPVSVTEHTTEHLEVPLSQARRNTR
ncbi:MAG: zinc ribbon domain-containing protein [Blastocatellia bacterium]|nr:zinc ribbon domain-containing protein [Blastocatellia bacterium]